MFLLLLLLLSVLWGWSTDSFLVLWFLLELNFLLFIPLLLFLTKQTKTTIKYFLIQAMASGLLLVFLLVNTQTLENPGIVVVLVLLWKLGGFPFYGWFLSMCQEVTWGVFFLLSTVQKLLPLYFLYFFMGWEALVLGVVNVLFAGYATFSANTGKSLLAFSSIFTLGWGLSSFLGSSVLWSLLMVNYLLILLFVVYLFESQNSEGNKTLLLELSYLGGGTIFLLFLVIGGIPPFLGFFLKVMVVLALLSINEFLMTVGIILGSLFMLYAYILLGFYSLCLQSSYPAFSTSNPSGFFTGGLILVSLWGIMLFNLGVLGFCMSMIT